MKLACFKNNTAGLLLDPKLGFEPYMTSHALQNDGDNISCSNAELRHYRDNGEYRDDTCPYLRAVVHPKSHRSFDAIEPAAQQLIELRGNQYPTIRIRMPYIKSSP